MKNKVTGFCLFLLLPVAIACRKDRVVVVEFEPNRVFAYNVGKMAEQPMDKAIEQTSAALEVLFGTPDEPKIPEFILDDDELAALVSLEKLDHASGAANETGRGIFRERCANCHGLTGDGRGTAAALLNPYPRDYRLGRFKFKSTPIGTKPTKQDIAYLIREGIHGTSMVKIPELTESDVDALTDYVVYLSWRGEVERALLLECEAIYFADGESLYDPSIKEADPEAFEEQWELIEDYTVEVAEQWLAAADRVIDMPSRDPALVPDTIQEVLAAMNSSGDSPIKDSVSRGRSLFASEKASCSRCHGLAGRGDGQTNDYDEWTTDWTKKFGIDPEDKDSHIPLIARGAFPVRKVSPRNFQEGVFRAGSSPEQLYQRIALGIEGTPMPAAAIEPTEVWDLVNFVRSLVLPAEEKPL
ncbi:MAG: cytochrome c [Planctomycetales bacterium]|nr:cytochrome c [Planctomycetales bacterium]